MTSLVSDFIINPVIRQARRFSAGFASDVEPASPTRRIASEAHPAADDAISESEEDAGPFTTGPATLISMRTGADTLSPPVPQAGFAATSFTSISTPSAGAPDLASIEADASSSTRSDERQRVRRPTATMASASSENVLSARRPTWMYRPSGLIPEDDGNTELRQRILAIQDRDIASTDKARLMHQVLIEDYTRAQTNTRSILAPKATTDVPASPHQPAAPGALDSLKFWNTLRDSSATPEFALTQRDLQPTFAPVPVSDFGASMDEEEDEEGSNYRPLGCEHYRRNVKLQCAECEHWYTCRFCHDAAESHALPRKATKYMLCMFCGCAQKASDTCTKCGESAARYYCNVCKLWNDDPNKSVYHCPDCGICRIGKGIGKDFYHCKRCIACIAIETETTHKCIERSTDCDCPICGDYMFTSPKTVIFMKCGHSIHEKCWQEYLKTSYKCPICSKSTVNMETQFRQLDIAIAAQPMPAEFENCRAIVLCNDCCAKSATKYHWLGLKCAICNSYNTAQLRIFTEEDASRDATIVQSISNPGAQGQGQAQDDRLPASAPPDGLANPGSAILAAVNVPHAPSLPRSGTLLGPRDAPTAFSPFLLPARLARSVSPIASSRFLASNDLAESHSMVNDEEEEEDTDEEDMIDFWGREESRNITSAESANGTGSQAGSEGDSDSDDCDEDLEDEEEEEEEEQISLFGHR